jgi:CRISPR-associated protein Cmr1
MVRKIGSCPAGPPIETGASAQVIRAYRVSVITPLFGGGVEAGVNDPVTLIRGASIRGQLRFWWRASRGASYESASELRKREGQVWGTATSPSPVQVTVKVVSIGQQSPWAVYEPDPQRGGVRSMPKPKPGFPAYALFPFKGETEKGPNRENIVVKPPATATWTAVFDLTLSWPKNQDLDDDVSAAVWAWINLGGLGSRTRRGCGSLYCQEMAPPDAAAIGQWYQDCLAKYGVIIPQSPRAWPTLPARLLVKAASGQKGPQQAWAEAIATLSEFRQGEGVGRNKGGKSPGRSRWPEPDSLRRITRRGVPMHMRGITTTENAFPRAEFGLPIVFHFKGDDFPNDSELYPLGYKRMASPLILKALALAPDRAVPMVARLTAPPVTALELTKVRTAGSLGEKEIRRPDLATYPNSPLAGRTKQGSALEAFINFAGQEGFK